MGALFDAVRAGVTALQAAEFYGMTFGRNRRARCPWHHDTHPDLAFYDDRCYCHACHSGGDATALTAQLFGISPLEAARKLNADFHLGADAAGLATPVGPSRAERRRQAEAHRNQRFSQAVAVERAAGTWLDANPCGWDVPGFRKHLAALALAQDNAELLHAMRTEDFNGLD